MRFDFTHGKCAKYMVSIYYPSGNADHIYYHYYRNAKAEFDKILNQGSYEDGTSVSLYDLKKDVRKEFTRVEKEV